MARPAKADRCWLAWPWFLFIFAAFVVMIWLFWFLVDIWSHGFTVDQSWAMRWASIFHRSWLLGFCQACLNNYKHLDLKSNLLTFVAQYRRLFTLQTLEEHINHCFFDSTGVFSDRAITLSDYLPFFSIWIFFFLQFLTWNNGCWFSAAGAAVDAIKKRGVFTLDF